MLASLVYEANGCFITNCPPGGKRSMSMFPAAQFRKEVREIQDVDCNRKLLQCTRCGPALSGRCFGPNICCSPLTGCSIGGPAASRCALEAYNPHLCTNPGPTCGPDSKGVCALNSTCCTSGESIQTNNPVANSSLQMAASSTNHAKLQTLNQRK